MGAGQAAARRSGGGQQVQCGQGPKGAVSEGRGGGRGRGAIGAAPFKNLFAVPLPMPAAFDTAPICPCCLTAPNHL